MNGGRLTNAAPVATGRPDGLKRLEAQFAWRTPAGGRRIAPVPCEIERASASFGVTADRTTLETLPNPVRNRSSSLAVRRPSFRPAVRVKGFADEHAVSLGYVLAAANAHEIWHLLLLAEFGCRRRHPCGPVGEPGRGESPTGVRFAA
jgi:hypothetical protein